MTHAPELIAKVIVTDAGPLITLAAAGRLDLLLVGRAPVLIPDAVLHEATKDIDALGATSILAWRDAHPDRVSTVSTEAFLDYVRALETGGGRRSRGLGERAALEVIEDLLSLADDERALLLTEDDKVLRQVLVLETYLTETIIPITTRDLIDVLEAESRVNSASDVFEEAGRAGRNASARRILDGQTPARREAVARLFRRS